MAEKVLMPKLGNSVESCVIVEWLVKKGDSIKEGETLCVVETDKAAVDVESTKSGVVLEVFFDEGDEVPIFTPIAVVGAEGETVDNISEIQKKIPEKQKSDEIIQNSPIRVLQENRISEKSINEDGYAVSPRAKKLAERGNVNFDKIDGTGPGGRIIERDIIKEIASTPSISPVASKKIKDGNISYPSTGSGIGGRIVSSDINNKSNGELISTGKGSVIPVKGMRKIISDTMLKSVTTTAQFSLHTSADASILLNLRKRFKSSDPVLGVKDITINDLIIFAISRTLIGFPDLNAHFLGNTIEQFDTIHMGIAVDSTRGLLVPVLRKVQTLTLQDIARKTKELYKAVENNTILPDDLSGSTFTITNLGSLGIENFTPVLNIPEVAILGICSIVHKPVPVDDKIEYIPYIGLSLTVNHQAVDGAPAAKFLQALCFNIKNLDLLMAV